MKKNKKYLLGIASCLFSLSIISCSDFLEPYPAAIIDYDEMWKRQENIQGLIGQCYEYMDRNYNNNNGYYLDGATDDAVITSTTHSLCQLATGAITTNNDPFKNNWINAYRAIRFVNEFLYEDRGYNTRFLIDDHYNDLVRRRLKGEAFALRAWYQWELLRLWGGVGIDSGELLGFPIVTEPIDVINGDCNLKRNTYEECVNQIIADCDSAYKYLPIAHRDFLVEDKSDLLYAGGKYWGRMDGITMEALKANVYLTWASPLFNPEGDETRWEKAALSAKKVIDFKLNVDGSQSKGFKQRDRVVWTDPNFPGIVFASRWNDNNDAMERALYPGGFQGNGVIGATQEFVDAFPMSNGYPKEHPEGAKLFDPANPYKNRDQRLYSMIFYNGAVSKKNIWNEVMYTFETWSNDTPEGVGKDAPGNSKTSRTGYHIKKFIYPGLNWGEVNPRKAPHSKFYIRWAHMVLAYAEAMNERFGPTQTGSGILDMSAKEAISMLRSRDTYDKAWLYRTSDPYCDEVANDGPDAFREFIKNESRIEKCFEGLRFFDIRRWSKPGDLSAVNKPVNGVIVTKKDDGKFEYKSEQVEIRNYPSLYLPIPYDEMLRMSNLEQNKGWDLWK